MVYPTQHWNCNYLPSSLKYEFVLFWISFKHNCQANYSFSKNTITIESSPKSDHRHPDFKIYATCKLF
jgi:hypothetical protein